MSKKRFPLDRRFSAALSQRAYDRLRALNEKYHYSNNYLLTIILENFDTIADEAMVEKVFARFAEEFGVPASGKMKQR